MSYGEKIKSEKKIYINYKIKESKTTNLEAESRKEKKEEKKEAEVKKKKKKNKKEKKEKKKK